MHFEPNLNKNHQFYKTFFGIKIRDRSKLYFDLYDN
jgi:hypothetical protein